MIVRDRPFDLARNDFETLWRFLQRDYNQKQDHFVWLFSRLGDWKYGLWNEKKYFPTFFRDYAHVWVDRFEELVGCVLSEDGENIFFIFTAPGYDYLYSEILDWTIQNWSARFPTLKAEVHAYQTNALAALEQRGFRSLGVAATTRAYDLRIRDDAAPILPSGFRIVDMRENRDEHNKALLYANGFGNKDQVTELDLMKGEYSHLNPAYDPAFDLSVVTAEGMHVATCVGFNDPTCSVAEVEKVCSHNQYRRRGLAQAVIQECFRRLKRIGIERAYITGYGPGANALYETLRPCTRKEWFQYERGTAERISGER